MVKAYHIIFTAYGFWLPNDPRGSWSDFVRSWELLKFGRATKVTTRRSLARDAHDRRRRLEAKTALRYPPVIFNGQQGREIARGFRAAITQGGYLIHACAIMPDHVHLVAGRDGRRAESIAAHFKRAASRQLRTAGVHPFQDQATPRGELPPCWARGEWKVFLNDDEGIIRAIQYVERNPTNDGLRPQNWSFVTPFV